MKLLLVDDSPIMRQMIKRYLPQRVKESWSVVEAENGLEGADLFEVERPDLVLMDLTMPVLDGIGASRRILEFDPSAKIVVISGDIQKKVVEEVLALGVLTHLPKPPNAQMLQSVFDQYAPQ
ncbi:MAG: hypothetical protein A2508_05420 [Candidatus Lambdaproteobacteria bacterium RIFOXYD12_FULL_49_8]|uniref:Response regulatory domain-containing protein n=1 Tax=Candidatus Lambdaproteobacteria bacterium RIFOXYD2_FULL_50_16 TaxID=1817772 RepID=A0A1F6GEP0_9PROT|nr:MAG: hypothetical protein A2527_03215 [Candidatus Lambdaproteobacteria bacterium RIFOXYD2_FULL_50_16]OGG97788.1 MAG: hypothetical protein A2508_05420 [Candidatus Lambdaproteobacteria bacterium RIFOXYD12_FULL_49_8]